MNRGLIFLAFVGLFCSASIAVAQEFLQYEGRNSIHEGQGGNRKTVNGVDFWSDGEPPRRYQVLGTITDERHKTGLWGMISMSNLESDIAKSAKSAGGDAVILVGAQDEVTGIAGSSYGTATGSGTATVNGGVVSGNSSASGFGFGMSRAIKQHDSRYLVVRYLPDAAPPAPAPVPPAPASAQPQQ